MYIYEYKLKLRNKSKIIKMVKTMVSVQLHSGNKLYLKKKG